MLLRLMTLCLVVCMKPSLSSALMASAQLGLGNSETSNEVKESEGPFVQVYTVERLFHSRLSLGVEHIRSLKSTMTSSISYTGLLARYYLNAGPMAFRPPEELSSEQVMMHDYCFFIGSGFGNAQSSRLPDKSQGTLSSNAAGIYLSPRFGADYQVGRRLGARGEFIFAQNIIGAGTIKTVSLSAGLYWLF